MRRHMSRLIWIYAVYKKPIIIDCGSERVNDQSSLELEFVVLCDG